jgi:hypothetical protein
MNSNDFKKAHAKFCFHIHEGGLVKGVKYLGLESHNCQVSNF